MADQAISSRLAWAFNNMAKRMKRLKGEINKRRRKDAKNGAALRQLVAVSPLAWRQLKMGMFSRQ